jgi:hypothetical protein
MTSQDDGEPKLWGGRCVYSAGDRCRQRKKDRDPRKQSDRNFRSYAADKEHCATRFSLFVTARGSHLHPSNQSAFPTTKTSNWPASAVGKKSR